VTKILIVEDDEDITRSLSDLLIAQRYAVESSTKGSEALNKLRVYKYDLIVLDWKLPEMSGLEVCQHFRAKGGVTPVLMLTGKDTSHDKETGLDAGADDYLTKPFDAKEFLARVRALLRRPQAYSGNVLKAGELSLDHAKFQVMRNSERINLEAREFALLEFFMRHQNQLFSPTAILDRVWESESDATPEALRQCISRLRKKIDVVGKPSFVRNIVGRGYKFEIAEKREDSDNQLP